MNWFTTTLTAIVCWSFSLALKVFDESSYSKALENKHFSLINYCQATEAALNDAIAPTRNSYPIDLFSSQINVSDTFPCYFEPKALRNTSHVCSRHQLFCPLNYDHITTALKINSASTAICSSMKAMRDKENVKVFVIGGSVTRGILTGGCVAGQCEPGKECNTDYYQFCSWSGAILPFLSKAFNSNKVIPVFLGEGATTTCYRYYTLANTLKDRNISISANDLFLLDYSVNDGIIFHTPEFEEHLGDCLRMLILVITSLSPPGVVPSIVLLEYWPYRTLDFFVPMSNTSYANIYRKVAAEYRIPIISYRDLYWSTQFRNDIGKYPKLDYIVFNRWASNTNLDIHPPWVVHNIYADLIASSFRRIEHMCHHAEFSKEVTYASPTPPKCSYMMVCMKKTCKRIIEVFARQMPSQWLSEKAVSYLPYEWKLYQDRPEKSGWIIQYLNIREANINHPSLSFSSPPVSQFTSGFLEIEYMITYSNAGAFSVSLCGKSLTSIDGKVVIDTLIADHYTNREVTAYEVNLQFMCGSNSTIEVTLLHHILPDHPSQRLYHKVKVSSIQLTMVY